MKRERFVWAITWTSKREKGTRIRSWLEARKIQSKLQNQSL